MKVLKKKYNLEPCRRSPHIVRGNLRTLTGKIPYGH
jgi:hypothetical protein